MEDSEQVEKRRSFGWLAEKPDAYLIVFGEILCAAISTYLVPTGQFDLHEVTVGRDGASSTRTVINPETFRYALDADGNPEKVTVSLFSGEAHLGKERIHRFPSDAKGEIGLFNYAFERITSGNKYGAAVGVIFRLNGVRLNDLETSFRKGAGDLLGAALIVGMAKRIILVLGGDDPTHPSVLNTILHAAGTWIEPLPGQASALAMFGFQSALNFFVPSGSGQEIQID